MSAEDAGGAGGDALCATLCAGGARGVEVMRAVLLCIQEAAEGVLSFGFRNFHYRCSLSPTGPLNPKQGRCRTEFTHAVTLRGEVLS